MTATFGKLNHETLTLKPGLNIIHAPNEWGKSTWCAFLIAMLYGIDTRQKNTKTVLADKERYAPWSGEPMSGRIELCWNHRDITIERSAKGRIPFGEFRAYETQSGLEIPELTAANCGQQLLGVESSVFTRAGFIRLQDMPVTQDDSLRRRLNNLVTTGDESGAGDRLGKQLRDLKNKCRYNRSGLLPQAEYEREQLRSQLQQREELQTQIQQIRIRQTQLERQIRELENHTDALRFEAAQQGVQKIADTEKALQIAEESLVELERRCDGLASMEDAQKALREGQELQLRQRQWLAANQSVPQPPVKPETPVRYEGVTPEEAVSKVKSDYDAYKVIDRAKKRQTGIPVLYGICAAILLIVMAVCYFALHIQNPVIYICGGSLIALSGILVLILCVAKATKNSQLIDKLFQKYPGITPDKWIADAELYAQAQSRYALAMEQYHIQCGEHTRQKEELEALIRAYAGAETLDECTAKWAQAVEALQALNAKRREVQNIQEHFTALQSVATTAPTPALPDALTLTASETESQLANCRFEQRQLQLQLGQCLGQADAIGGEDSLKARLDSVSRRINRLEEYYRALEMAQEALYQASTSLQRRFAPRISKRAQQHFSQLTGGRYQRLTLSDDLSLQTSAENEDTLRSAGWRSDGTVDQLYLSLRLAVAGELTPDAPLILDDALVRFDDERLKAALKALQEEAASKQVILFTCQQRESNIVKEKT